MADPLEQRRAEQARLIAAARDYVERTGRRVRLVAAAVVGSVARGDFNVWSDIDVVIIAEELPKGVLERQGLLLRDVTPGIQPVAFTPTEFREALVQGNRLAREALESGVPLFGERFFTGAAVRDS